MQSPLVEAQSPCRGSLRFSVSRSQKRGEYRSLLREQILASVGQPLLMAKYQKFFKGFGVDIAQILVTRANLSEQESYESLCEVVNNLLALGIVPIFNENDVLSPEELDFSDNDQLACMISAAFKADKLVLLTNVDGVYDRRPDEPGARRIPVVEDVEQVLRFADKSRSDVGKGGMQSKLEVARVVTGFGIGMYIANGGEPRVLSRLLLRDEALGTSFPARGKKLRQTKSWVALAAASRGDIVVSTFCAELLKAKKPSSILLIGVEDVAGDFEEGDVVSVRDLSGTTLGRGQSRMSASEIRGRKAEMANDPSGGLISGGKRDKTHIVIHADYFVFAPG